jgi:hypothetical protein
VPNSLLLFMGCALIAVGAWAIFLSRVEVHVTFDPSVKPTFPMEFRLSISTPGDYTFKVYNAEETQLNRVR